MDILYTALIYLQSFEFQFLRNIIADTNIENLYVRYSKYLDA